MFFSPDEELLAIPNQSTGINRLISTSTGEIVAEIGGEAGAYSEFSPDSRWLTHWNEGVFQLVSVKDGNKVIRIPGSIQNHHLLFRPTTPFSDECRLIKVYNSDTESTEIVEVGTGTIQARYPGYHQIMKYSPDNQWFLFVDHHGVRKVFHVSHNKPLLNSANDYYFLPDGYIVAALDFGVDVYKMDG